MLLSLYEVYYDNEEPPMYVMAESLMYAIKKFKENVMDEVNRDFMRNKEDTRLTLEDIEDPVAVSHIAFPESILL